MLFPGILSAVTVALGMQTSLRKLAEVGPQAMTLVCGLIAVLAIFALTAIVMLHV